MIAWLLALLCAGLPSRVEELQAETYDKIEVRLITTFGPEYMGWYCILAYDWNPGMGQFELIDSHFSPMRAIHRRGPFHDVHFRDWSKRNRILRTRSLQELNRR